MTNEIQGLHNLVASPGARKKPKRLGRGESSGHGKTSGKGHKGQKARKSGNVRPGFEGGQIPLSRRLPKFGFKNFDFRRDYVAVNVGRLAEVFTESGNVGIGELIITGLLRKPQLPVKVLAEGDISHALHLTVHKISQAAREKIEKAGGSVTLLDD